MILDTSVIVAIVLREPGYEELVGKLRSADSIGIGTPTLTEAGIVLAARLGIEPQALLDRFFATSGSCRWPLESSTGGRRWMRSAVSVKGGILPPSTLATV